MKSDDLGHALLVVVIRSPFAPYVMVACMVAVEQRQLMWMTYVRSGEYQESGEATHRVQVYIRSATTWIYGMLHRTASSTGRRTCI